MHLHFRGPSSSGFTWKCNCSMIICTSMHGSNLDAIMWLTAHYWNCTTSRQLVVYEPSWPWELNVQRIVPLHSRRTIAQQWCHNKFVLRIMWICTIRIKHLKALFGAPFLTFESRTTAIGPKWDHRLWSGVPTAAPGWQKLYFKRVKIDKWPDSPCILIFPIDYCVRLNALPARLFSGDIQSHIWLDNYSLNFIKLLHSWLFIDLYEHHYTALISK